MIGMMNAPTLPPVTLTDEAMKLAAMLLAIAADPSGTKSRLDELNTATTTLRATIDEQAAARKQAEDAAAALAGLQAQAQDLAGREAALTASQTQLQVASAAIADRDQAVKDKEAELAKREQEHQARVKANEDRIASVRASLA